MGRVVGGEGACLVGGRSWRGVTRKGVAGAAESYVHAGIGGNMVYYYALYVHNGRPTRTYSSGATVSSLAYSAADFDGDRDVDLSDFSRFQTCFNGPNRPATLPSECGMQDLDGDADVDLSDFSRFQTCFSGPNRFPLCGF